MKIIFARLYFYDIFLIVFLNISTSIANDMHTKLNEENKVLNKPCRKIDRVTIIIFRRK